MAQTDELGWWKQLQAGYVSGSAAAFILHGNTRDYVEPGLALAAFLTKALANRSVLTFYNPATGFRFPYASHEQIALRIAGNEQQAVVSAAQQMLMGGGQAAPQQLPKDVSGALDAIDKLLRCEQSTAVVIEYGDKIWPDGVYGAATPADRRNLAMALEWGRKGDQRELQNMLIVITDDGLESVNEALRGAASGYKPLHIAKPSEPNRLRFIEAKVDELEICLVGIDCERLARMTAGLSLLQIEDLLLEAQWAGQLTTADCKRLKDAMIEAEYAGLVTIVDPEPEGLAALGGKEELKAWLRAEVIAPLQDGRIEDALKGFILTGPPGTGKTYMLACLAGEVGFQMIALDAGRVQGQYVGQSQQRLRKVFELAETIAPVVMFMDELDQSDMTSRGQGSGNPVASDLFNMMLKFLGDPRNRGRVIFVGASNRPDLMDGAFKRSGRIDAIVPVLLPDAIERYAILAVQARRQDTRLDENAHQRAVLDTEKWSGADLEQLVRKARKEARTQGHKKITLADMQTALRKMRPDTSQSDFFTMLAVRACTEIGLLPDDVAALSYEEMDKQVDERAPTRRGGRSL